MNHLQNQTSPHLLQHRDNPVDWYPWNSQTLAHAKEQNKPILLSIGYSACHWCHVMAHESFEDAETAAIMNQEFINIKVDREERPDIDKIYQRAQQVLNHRSGGWPLTAFLSPDTQIPFFIGTYFPKDSRYGLPSFKKLLQEIAANFHTHRKEITEQNNQVQDILNRLDSHEVSTDPLSNQPFLLAKKELENSYDTEYGGFTGAPKFPQATYIDQLFHYYFLSKNKSIAGDYESLLMMASTTLKKMAFGGLYDQLGGGFFRYSTDKYWMIPHFEKMLYDNAALLLVYTYAWKITDDAFFKQIAEETATWILREMQSPEGGYYSSLDADTQGVEGQTYVWEPSEIKKLLDREEYKIMEYLFGLDKPPNFEGKWHLYVARQLPTGKEAPEQIIMSAKTKLLAARQQREQPACDNKILTSWNGLMLKAMAITGKILHRQDCLESAINTLNFIHSTLWKNNRLLATYKDGKAHLNAYLDDYAFVIEAILRLLESHWNSQHFNFAIQLAECLLTFFYDQNNGGFYFTSHDHEKLIQRYKPFMDEATPSGNGVAALMFIRLGHLLGETRYLAAAEATLKIARKAMKHSTYAYGTLLFALEEMLTPPDIIILCYRNDDKQDGTLKEWQTLAHQMYHPHRICFSLSEHEPNLPSAFSYYRCIDNKMTAYLCRGTECSIPITDFQEFKAKISRLGQI